MSSCLSTGAISWHHSKATAQIIGGKIPSRMQIYGEWHSQSFFTIPRLQFISSNGGINIIMRICSLSWHGYLLMDASSSISASESLHLGKVQDRILYACGKFVPNTSHRVSIDNICLIAKAFTPISALGSVKTTKSPTMSQPTLFSPVVTTSIHPCQRSHSCLLLGAYCP